MSIVKGQGGNRWCSALSSQPHCGMHCQCSSGSFSVHVRAHAHVCIHTHIHKCSDGSFSVYTKKHTCAHTHCVCADEASLSFPFSFPSALSHSPFSSFFHFLSYSECKISLWDYHVVGWLVAILPWLYLENMEAFCWVLNVFFRLSWSLCMSPWR